MRPMIVLAPKQIDSDRLAPGITTSAVGGVEVNSSCDYTSPFPGAGVALTLLQPCMRRNVHTPSHTKAARRGHNGRSCAYMLLRPV